MATHEGWKNRETWNVALWLDNEYPLYLQKVSFLRACVAPIADLGVTPALVGFVQRWCESIFPKGTPDIGSEGMTQVDWAEIAEHFLSDALELDR